jgi:hypothetical protein
LNYEGEDKVGRINEKYKNKLLVAVYGSLKKGF